MPDHFEETNRIDRWIHAKKRNEFELAERILIEVNNPALRSPLLGWVERAIQELDQVRRVDLEGQGLVSQAWNNERPHLETLRSAYV